ncbi:FAD-binding monooxygenase [Schumannella sp. 10F1B-5-1]|uniref:FAD-binding monooxygenase n=1 Tax=Schumannella sp. 10F1B-5-1 TaxID=2590780 RepID=UPI0011303F84|nr:FAD-binding monooxygenase [Schumannella sp. 10F1B-5-1]TPW78255.1 3-hydroxybenzoate 4-monooxygenase [Schumannella sp. 10F1B-5-1]
MQFHHHGYVSGDPRVQAVAGTGVDRPDELPDEVDVLIVGTGPAGMITAAQLAQFPGITTRIVERRGGRLAIGQADGIQARSVETFQAFGFAERITAEAYRITEMAFWKPDPADPTRIVRTARPLDDEIGVSEFPHLIVNQARVLDYFAEVMAQAPTRSRPDYGWEFDGLEIAAVDGAAAGGDGDAGPSHPVTVTLIGTAGPQEGTTRTVRARYVVGADGARSKVRESIGAVMAGDRANHAWGVMDTLAVTDFPDIRTKCAIQSTDGGSILLIPREGGHLFRMYVDLGEVAPGGGAAVRQTSLDEIIARANQILAPYALDVKDVPWHSVYEVGHRVTDRFDDVPVDEIGTRTPRVFILGDACHIHSAKAGQGMNVSMQDGFNLAWKLGHVLEGRSPEALLSTYSAERQVVAQNLIDFDREWSSMMAKRPEEFADPAELERFYVSTAEFPAGFMTEYAPSLVVGSAEHQRRATGFPLGKRFRSARVARVCDGNAIHLGHHATADGRWRVYVFADADADADADAGAAGAGADAAGGAGADGAGVAHPGLDALADWLATSPASPLAATPAGLDPDAWFDVKVIYPEAHPAIEMPDAPDVFRPRVGPFGLIDDEKVFATLPGESIFAERGIDAGGAVVVVRPDQYVAAVLPLDATDELAAFFAPLLASAHPVG